MQYGRTKKIVEMAIKSAKLPSMPKPPVLKIHELIKFSVNCHEHGGNRNKSKNVCSYGRKKANERMHASVRRLNGKFIKVEDVAGKYRPQTIEMEEWPQLQFHYNKTPFTCPKILKSLPTNYGVKRKLCELCNSYYSDIQHHVNGSEHQRNAHDDTLFESLDALIRKKPAILD